MDPIIGGALISGASSLLGGIFGGSKSEYVVPNYQKIRTKAEAAGFNPLTALAMAPGQVVQSQNYMGSAIADAGLALADGLVAKDKKDGALAKLAEENDKLRETVQNMTLRPKVPGVYAQREAIPSVSQAVGGGNVQTSQVSDQTLSGGGASVGGSNLSSGGGGSASVKKGSPDAPPSDPLDPSRAVDKLKVTSDAGFGIVDNAVTGPFHIPLVNGEMPDLTQLLVLGGSYVADRGYTAIDRYLNPPPPPRDPRGVLAGKKPLFPVGYRGLLPNEIPAGSRPLSGLAHPRQTSDAWWKSQRRKPFGF